MLSKILPDRRRACRAPVLKRLAVWFASGVVMPFAMSAQAQAAVVISQVYGGGGNAGATLQNDFIEIFNNGSTSANIGGWSVQYAAATGTSWQVTAIPAGTSLQPGQYLLIREAAGSGGTVTVAGDVSGTVAMAAASGKVALTNSIAALSGAAPAGGSLQDIVSYGSATPTEGTPTAVLSATAAALRNAGGCTDTNNNLADFSIGTPSPRNASAPLADCGGTVGGGDGSGGPLPIVAAIYTIQGSGAQSPLVGRQVTTTGVVTKLVNNGFFMQDLVGDGDPTTSDGIYVFTSGAPAAAAVVGNLVQVSATVSEFSTGAGTAATPLTELTAVTALNVLGSGYSIAPTAVKLPLAAGDSLERFEGMLVRFDDTLTVEQNYFQARYGQLTLGIGRHETPTNLYRPGSPQAIALADLQARSRFLLDDGTSLQNTSPTAYQYANGVPRAGDLASHLVGVLDYGPATSTASGPGLYRLQPTEPPVFAIANPRSPSPPAVGGNLRLGSMNVLNFFTTFTDGSTASGQTGQGCSLGGSVSASNCRGANSLTEFLRQRAKIVNAILGLNADAVGLMEMQNNGDTAVQNLVDALNAAAGPGTYAVVPAPKQGTGTDAIRVAMIYKPGRLSLVNASVSDPSSINNRPPLAQAFAALNGERFTLLVNHLKSKSSCPTVGDADYAGNFDAGDGQGCWNAQRVAQASQLRSFVAQVQASNASKDVLLVGDFNAYAQEDPIYNLTSSGYVDQSGRFETLGYSYVFDGTAGRLDHAIGTPSLSAKVTGAAHWHIDADEGLQQDYNLEFKQPACATCAPDPFDGSVPYRASDHDPVLVGLSLFKTILGTPGRDVLVGTPGDDVIIGGAGADTLTGGGGTNVFVYTSIRDAGDTITDFVPGKDFLDLRTLLQSLGYAGTDPVVDGLVSFAPTAGGTSVLISGRPLLTLSKVSPAGLDAQRDLIVK